LSIWSTHGLGICVGGFGKTAWRVVVEVPKPLRKLLDGKPRFVRSQTRPISLTEASRLNLPW
jgi:hypothetical protein